MVRTGARFADAAAEFLRYVADERGCKPSTLRDYRSIIDAPVACVRRGPHRGRPAGGIDFSGQAIRVRASYAGEQLTTPKSGKLRSVPMAPDVAAALAALGRARALDRR